MTKKELINLVENIFDTYGIKIVSTTDVNKSAYVPNMLQKQIFESFGINPLNRRQDIEIKELFTNRILTISYYATLRVGANRSPEPRMGLTDLISYLSVGDEILFTKDNNNIFIYNLSGLDDNVSEENLYSQIDVELLRERATNINTTPSQVEQTVRVYPRNNILRTYVKERSNYSCEMPDCDYIGFNKNDSKKYIEIHHVDPLSEGGEDSISNTVALCPNCHRKIHYAENKEELKQTLQSYLTTLS
jgi:5-methylcytosine-specific restriction endonuclease McrA